MIYIYNIRYMETKQQAMKKRNIMQTIATAFALAAALGACADQTDGPGTGEARRTPLALTTTVSPAGGSAEMPATRMAGDISTTAELQNTQLASGAAVSLYFAGGNIVKADGTEALTATATADGSGGLSLATVDGAAAAGSLYMQLGEQHAWVDCMHPTTDGAGAAVGPEMTTFTVAQDQSTAAGYQSSDLMYGSAAPERPLDSYDDFGVPITLTHRMALVSITANAQASAGSVVAVRLIRGFRTVSIDNGAKAALGSRLTTPVSRDAALTAYKEGTTASVTAHCLLPPQTLAAGDFIEVETTQGTATFRLTASHELLGGCSYAVSVTVAATSFSSTTAVTSWTENGVAQHQARQRMLTFHVGGVPLNMMFVEGGPYSHTISKTTINGTLSDYYVAETEVTNALYRAVIGQLPTWGTLNAAPATGDNYPVQGLFPKYCYEDYDDAHPAFLKRLNELTAGQRPAGWYFDITSDQQWLYAARGGKHARGGTYAGGSDAEEVAWFSGATASPVGLKAPNELGIYDMSGNMWENCKDRYDDQFYQNQQGAATGAARTINAERDYVVNNGEGTYCTPWGGSYRATGGTPIYDYYFGSTWHYDVATSELGSALQNSVRLTLVKMRDEPIAFSYNGTNGSDGSVQTWRVPTSGRYQIECWGAQGGGYYGNEGGGYCTTVVYLEEGQTLYIYVGGRGEQGDGVGHNSRGLYEACFGGWNGGGIGGKGSSTGRWWGPASGGGGATHVATVAMGPITADNGTTLLHTGTAIDALTPADGLIAVAGGAAGGAFRGSGGAGGGIEGMKGSPTHASAWNNGVSSCGAKGSDGNSQSNSAQGAGGGGGGYVGGNAWVAMTGSYQSDPGNGGSSWARGTRVDYWRMEQNTWYTVAGQNMSGHGRAAVTYLGL